MTAGRWIVAYLTSFIVAFDLLQMLRHQYCCDPDGELGLGALGLHETLAFQSRDHRVYLCDVLRQDEHHYTHRRHEVHHRVAN